MNNTKFKCLAMQRVKCFLNISAKQMAQAQASFVKK